MVPRRTAIKPERGGRCAPPSEWLARCSPCPLAARTPKNSAASVLEVPRYRPKPHHCHYTFAPSCPLPPRTTARPGPSSPRRPRVRPHQDDKDASGTDGDSATAPARHHCMMHRR
ncbi:hypothetical protein SVAN01_05699 [Stagonosporopsis vannaccii]|nr:hypothetical protein SVAN01_05699 [Stagonosporopsis vannaccii]